MRLGHLPATAALLAAASLILLLAVACDEAGKPPFLPETSPTPTETTAASPTPLPTPSPTGPAASPSPESQGMDGFRAFAAQIAEAVAAGDGSLFVARARLSEETCSGTDELGPCAGKPAGTKLEGLWQGLWRTDAGGLVPAADIASAFEAFVDDARAGESDSFGSGNAVLYALASNRPGVFGEGEAYYAVVTAIQASDAGPERRILTYQFTFDGERWRVYGVIEAGALFEEWLTGDCAGCYQDWERWEGNP